MPPPSDDQHQKALSGAVRSVSGMTLLSRLGGLVREVLVARIFRDTATGSAFAAGFAIPNMFRRLFGEGALSAAFIPEYTRAHRDDPEVAGRLASITVWWLLLLTTGLTVLVEAGLLIAILTMTMTPTKLLSFKLVMLMLPFMPLVCTAAILGGMLQVHGRFAPPASGPIVMNSIITVVGLSFLFSGQTGDAAAAYWLGAATVVSGITQCVWFTFLLRRYVRWSRVFAGAKERALTIKRKFIPAAVGMGTLQINAFLDMLLAMWPIWVGTKILGIVYPMDDKSNIILSAAQRLYQFPLGVFGIAVATAVFPLLSRHADDAGHFAQTLRRGIRLSLFIGLPASVGLALVSEDLIAVVYGGSSGFTDKSLTRCTAVLVAFAPAVWAYSLNHVFTRAFYAKGDTTTPMRVAIGMVAFNLILNLALIWPLKEAGLALSTSISAALQSAILLRLSRRLCTAPPFDRQTFAALARIAGAAAIMGGLVWLATRLAPPASAWLDHLLRLGLLCGVGGVAFAAAAYVLKCHELGWLLRRR